MITIKQVIEVTVIDPDTQQRVDIAIYKMSTGAMVGIDSSAVDQVDIFDPYTKNGEELTFEEDL